jgi:hypothetical protein
VNDIITTKSIGFGIAEVEGGIILCEEPMSRLIFRAQIHEGGIKGRIIRERRESKDDSYVPDEAIDIRTLSKKESINLELNTESVSKLYSAILKLANILSQRGVEYGEHKYAVVNPDSVIITDQNKITYIKKLIEAGYDEDIWNKLVESNPSLVTKLSHARIQECKRMVVQEFSQRLETGGYSETSGDDSWQKWIYSNNWLFGVNYKKPIEKTKISISGVMPDFLFPTLDGFVDILEIKLPTDGVLHRDTSHVGSWMWTNETNSAIGQVVNYLNEIDRLRLEIEKNVKTKYDYEICLLKPRVYILIGDNADWDSEKKEGLRKMNHALHGIEVLTYRDLLDRGNQAINIEL